MCRRDITLLQRDLGVERMHGGQVAVLLEEHSNLATVHALYAEVALQQGDIATAHAFWSGQLAQDPSRISPQLSLGRIALLGGDPDEARSALQRALTDLPSLTAAQ